MKRILIVISCIFFSCSDEPKTFNLDSKNIDELLIETNRLAIKKEAHQIDSYVKRKKLDVVKTGTGLRYQIYEEGKGNLAKLGEVVQVNYEISLLNGTICYSNKKKAPEEFVVGKDNVETGLHEVITYLKEGDKALVIIPSHLAHGLVGDFNKIPMRSTIVCDLELVAIK